jgi:hypothetical protein
MRNALRLAAFYNMIHVREGLVPNFHVFTILCERSAIETLKKRLQWLVLHPPEYDVRSRDNSKNCVSLSVDLFKEHGILAGDFSLRGQIPRPRELDAAFRSLADQREDITFQSYVLDPARFSLLP